MYLNNQWCFVWLIFTYSNLKYVNHPFYLYIPTVTYIFQYVFNKLYPGWLDMGAHQSTGGRVSQYVPWGHSFLLYEARIRASAWVSLLWVRVSTQCIYQVHVQTFLPKRAWHHWGIMCWHQMSYDDILVMWGISDDNFYVSIERGIKGKMHER